ncbi:MAG: hypothetical protein ACK5Z5_05810, partial [Neisseriaceae bacterium]
FQAVKNSNTPDQESTAESNRTNDKKYRSREAKRLQSSIDYKKGSRPRTTRNSIGEIWESLSQQKKHQNLLKIRFAKNPEKYVAYTKDGFKAKNYDGYKYFSLNSEGDIEDGLLSPNSNTPHVIVTPNGTELKRFFAMKNVSAYTSPKSKKKLDYTENMDLEVDDEIRNNISIPWNDLKSLSTQILTSKFKLGPKFERIAYTRQKTQNQVMMNISAREVIANLIESGGSIVQDLYKEFLEKISLLKDGKIIQRSLEYRHLAPFAVLGNDGQIQENLAAGPAYTNTIELCIELALYEIAKGSINLEVTVNEYIINDNIGLFREYIILNKMNDQILKIKFPTLCCFEKPPLFLKDHISSYIKEQLKVSN